MYWCAFTFLRYLPFVLLTVAFAAASTYVPPFTLIALLVLLPTYSHIRRSSHLLSFSDTMDRSFYPLLYVTQGNY
ncbi:hypothetical protein B0H16DRAFT_1502185 [Mycena metata]|uniref:Uncharacterized protein n=1 Tax=Mycena metata TaxID=1033252 RepID=A0AAD7NVX0_9AGAR|nr:hypothetical protein B0H16DRAFT_1502185 [Mycena metata]